MTRPRPRSKRSRITGARELKYALRAAPAALREMAADQIEETVDAVHEDGLRNMESMVRPLSGRLRKHYKKRLSRKALRGHVGYRGKRAARDAFHALLVHNGTRWARARPFHDRAVLKHMPPYQQRMTRIAELALRRRIRR